MRLAEKVTRNIGVLRRELTGKPRFAGSNTTAYVTYANPEQPPTTRAYWVSLITDEEKAEVEYRRLSDMMAPGGPLFPYRIIDAGTVEATARIRSLVWGMADDEKRHAQQLRDVLDLLVREGKIV